MFWAEAVDIAVLSTDLFTQQTSTSVTHHLSSDQQYIIQNRAGIMGRITVSKPEQKDVSAFPREYAIYTQIPGALDGKVDSEVRLVVAPEP